MFRKTAIGLCVVGVLAPLVLWIESFRPRYTLAELEALGLWPAGSGDVPADPADRAALANLRLKDTNCDTAARMYSLGRRTLELSLSHRLVSPRHVPDSAREKGGMTLTILQGGPRTDVQSPGIFGFRYTRVFAPGDKGARGGMYMGSKVGFYYARVAHGGTNPGVMYSLAFPAWRLSFPFLIGLVYLGIKPARHWHRRRRRLCVRCKYDLRGTESGRCPECGTAISNLKSQI